MTKKHKLSADGTWAADYGAICNKNAYGVVGAVLELGWGVTGEAVTFTETGYLHDTFLYDRDASVAIDDILKNAKAVICCRPSGGEYASCTFGRARYTGTAGNRIVISCREEENGGYEVITYVDGVAVDSQTVSDGTLTDNDYVIFDQNCEFFVTAGIPMTGGVDADVTDAEYADCLRTLSDVGVDMLICNEREEVRVAAFVDTVLKNRGGGGVMRGITSADIDFDSEDASCAVTSVYCEEKTAGAVYYLAGLLASLPFYSSAVGKKYEGAFPYSAFDASVAANAPRSRLVLVERGGEAYVYGDGSVFDDHGESSRICDEIKRAAAKIFFERFCGKVKADGTGAALLRSAISDIIRELDVCYGSADGNGSDVCVSVDESGDVYVTLDVKHKPRVRGIGIGTVMR